MKYEWDEKKNKTNIKKHGIDFRDAQDIYQGKMVSAEDTRHAYGEKRMITVGMIGESVCVVVHTTREDTVRIISARKANERERRRYYEKTEKPKT